MINLFDKTAPETDFTYMLDMMGQDITLNTTPAKVLITNMNLEQNYDDKRITSYVLLKRGDMIEWKDKQYMIISEVNDERYIKYKAIMRHLPHKVIINSGCQFYTVYAYADLNNWTISGGSLIQIADGKLELVTSSLNTDVKPKINNRFILNGQAFKITSIDTYSRVGEMILGCEKDQTNTNDDLENGIAGIGVCGIKITNTEDSMNTGGTLQLTYTAPDGVPVVFESSDTNIATVSETGLITAYKAGTVTITVANKSYTGIKDSITLNVIEAIQGVTISIEGKSEIYFNQTSSYTVNVSDGSSVTWEVFADDEISNTSLVSIAAQTGTSCTIKAGSKIGYVQLKATLENDKSVEKYKRIRVKSLI